ncbi:MAG: rRNA maturation RNase YbeY [Chlamydiia bacterium]|nr:rRNA maturation RNase YbeY [Chlamydiia bacterium]
MVIFLFNQQRDLRISLPSVRQVITDVLENAGVTTNELSISFVSTRKSAEMHAKFFDDPTPTDCMTFPVDEIASSETDYHVLGEIVICPKTALNYAPQAPYKELTLYLVHGLLHLLGYDDIETSNRKKMRAAESKHMKRLIAKKILLKEPISPYNTKRSV